MYRSVSRPLSRWKSVEAQWTEFLTWTLEACLLLFILKFGHLTTNTFFLSHFDYNHYYHYYFYTFWEFWNVVDCLRESCPASAITHYNSLIYTPTITNSSVFYSEEVKQSQVSFDKTNR